MNPQRFQLGRINLLATTSEEANSGAGIWVDLISFLEFGYQFTEELEEVIERWRSPHLGPQLPVESLVKFLGQASTGR